ncbi:S-layer homology domain-containing protein [Veillonella sp.]|uniref:S-layer homology domain-containing protein n=1 Tax=Veillonella sp. TaxID=1926307 RepID=UPI002906BE29|nr:S-layer homology domain-containing protein [Veillonella sp.]MDU3563908.1 S-layer homology domain-containing protein [Veillonella sp.]MDU3631200.1 S-layer homology domain-containing protein [Veillonella sp.]
MNKRRRLLTMLINGVLLSSLWVVASAADTTTGGGSGVAYGTGSSAPKAENVAVGKGAAIQYSNGASAATGDIAVGSGAVINNYASQGGSVAIGKNAKIENMAGGVEAAFALGQTTYSGSLFSAARIPADPTKVVGSVAIGDNTFARTGSTMIGSHNYKGDLGDTTVDSASTRKDALNAYATTVGANSFTNGAFATNTGTYNIISSEYNGGRFSNPVKNLASTVNGSFNSNESKMASSFYSGIGNSIVGTANRTFNSNGSIVMGAGNEITNSVTPIPVNTTDAGSSAKEFAETLRTAVKNANGGGSTMALGGANKADYTLRTSMIGINNTVTGVKGGESKDNLAMGVGNTATKVQHMTAIGSKNTVSDATDTIIVGDNRTVTGANNTVTIGSSDAGTTTTVNEAVAIGHNTEVTAEGGVALGSGSKATVAAGGIGYDVKTGAASTETGAAWKATSSAVSVGDVANNVTRQITSVAAGTDDSDAVNVAQLKKAEEKINDVEAEAKKHTTVVAGDNTTVTAGTNAAGGAEYKVSVKKDLEDMNSVNFGKITDDVRARIDKDSARFFNGSENIGITPKGIQIENTDTLEQANFTKYGMYASEGDKTVYYTTNGISAGDQKINNVKAGEADTDAVNVGQLKKVDDKVTAVENKVNTVETKVNTIETKVNTIETKVNDVETKVNNVDTKVNNLETKVNTVEAEAKKHTTVVAGDNTTVTQGTNANGGAEYKVAVNKDLVEMNSVNFGKATDDVRARIDKDSARFFNGSENIGVTPKGIQIENTDTLEQATFTKSGMYASEGDKTVYYTTNGISAGDQIINNVKAGVADTDAVNVSQLKKVKDEITAATGTTTVTAGDHITVTPTINGNSRDYKVSLSKDITDQINNNTTNIDKNKTEINKNRNDINKNKEDIKNIKGNVTDIQNNITNINNNMNSFKGDLSKMDKRIDKSVAGAAALAALHPLDFDPDAKWDFAAGYGHYRSGDAAAIGAFYRPNEDVQLSIGSTVGGDETVFNAGLSVKVGAHNGVSRSRVAIGKEVLALKKTVAEQNAQIQKLTALLNGVAGTKMKADHTTLFPDVAANHWAYEAVSDLSRRGLVEGYPDGTFGGDRLLTRYEFAQIVYRAIQDGVTVDDRLVTEFSPEMALFRVDTVAKNAQGEPTIERVRVNKK